MSSTDSAPSPPLPSSSAYISAVRSSCSSASTHLSLTPNLPAIDAFLLSLSPSTFQRLAEQHGLTFPLRFPTPTAEVNFLSILALLNSFSGYRTAFHRATGSGAYQNVVRFMIGLYISSDAEDRIVGAASLTAKGLRGLTEAKVVELMGVSVHEEREHETLKGVTVGVRGGEMLDVVQMILKALKGVAGKLQELGEASLGSYVVGLLEMTRKEGMVDDRATDFLTQRLAETFIEFRDTHSITGAGEVFLFKRIFFLLHSLRLRFGEKQEWFVPDTKRTLPMFVDNVLPTMCVWLNMFSVPAEAPKGMETMYEWVRTKHCNADLPREKLTAGGKDAGPELSQDETYAIRAATLNVGRVVVERAKELAKEGKEGSEWLAELNEVDLDGYLWSVAKDDEALRSIPRLVFRSIHF
ncbi:Queuosine salvage protein [Pseudozyma hubeiensis]|nr:Queuosine salvage protein [Pseudozyma hubeiensis]